MAGIAAIFGSNAENETDLVRMMLSRMKHRGPRYEGTFSANSVLLGFVGKKTNASSDSDAMPYIDIRHQAEITCDAEIYNHETILMDDAKEIGATSQSARAIVATVLDSNETFEDMLDGPFSFVVHRSDHIYAGRDRLGIAPLYMEGTRWPGHEHQGIPSWASISFVRRSSRILCASAFVRHCGGC